jgi:hypothetical protein
MSKMAFGQAPSPQGAARSANDLLVRAEVTKNLTSK